MKKSILLAIFTIFLTPMTFAADVVCGCEDDSCKDIEVSFSSSNPGVYMSVSYNDGNKVVEGYALVSRNKDNSRVMYTLKKFVLVKEGSDYSMPLNPERACQ